MATNERRKAVAKPLIAGLLVAALGSCSFEYRLVAAFIQGRLAFIADGDSPAGENTCLYRLAIFGQDGAPVWQHSRTEAAFQAAEPCDQWLPILYGRAPRGSETAVQARRLRTGVVYTLNGSSGDLLQAAFRFHGQGNRIRVENLDLGSNEAIAARTAAQAWQDREYRRGQAENLQPKSEIVEGPYLDRPLPAERD